MNDLIILIFGVMTLAGAIYAGYARDPYVKLIAIGLVSGSIIPLIVDRGYLDVAAALAVIIPLSTVFVLQICRKGEV